MSFEDLKNELLSDKLHSSEDDDKPEVERILNLPPCERLTTWEAKQLIAVEVYEYAADKSIYEANDIFGNARYLGLPLFLDALDIIVRKNLGMFLTVKHAWELLTSDPNVIDEFSTPHPRIANFKFAVLNSSNKLKIDEFIASIERSWIYYSKREIGDYLMHSHYPKIMQ